MPIKSRSKAKRAKRKTAAGRERPRSRKTTPRTSRKPGLRIKWSNLGERLDESGKPLRRFYKLETLSSAVDKQVLEKGGFIANAIENMLGRVPLTSMTFELVQENTYRYVFRMRVINTNKKRASLAVVAAKNSEELSTVLNGEHRNLAALHERAPRLVVQPYGGGEVYLPDRHRRRTHGREVYAYATLWPAGHFELGIGRNQQFFVNAPRKSIFTRAESERIKQRILEIIVRTYDPARRIAIDLQSLAPGDFVATRPKSATPRLQLVACRQTQRNVSPQKLLHELLFAKWKFQGKAFPLQPADPKWVIESILNAAGKIDGTAWLKRYAGAVERETLPESKHLPLEILDELGFSGTAKPRSSR